MANLLSDEPRDLVPYWRSFNITTALGELSPLKEKEINSFKYPLDLYIIDFKKNRTIAHAADLISAGISNNQCDNLWVCEAASFLLNNSNYITYTQKLLANKILYPNSKLEEVLTSEVSELTNFSSVKYYDTIRNIKEQLRVYPYNPILLVELSRYYSTIGLKNKSIDAMKKAIHFGKNNRFVLRSASMLFAHYSDEDLDNLIYIRKLLNSSGIIQYDTWLMATEIAISVMLEKGSKYIKKGLFLINSGNYSNFNLTELRSSIASVELRNGNHKKSRQLFKSSMNNPNDNSLAQITWASTEDKLIKLGHMDKDRIASHEAISLELYLKKDFENSFKSAVKWFIDQPFSSNAAIFGSFVANSLTKKQDDAIALAKAGLISNPHNNVLLNNLAYSLALDGKTEDALTELAKVKVSTLTEESAVCIKATNGLIAFRSGKIDLGRKLYQEAIEDAKELNNKSLNWTAILNYAREELLSNTKESKYLMDIVSKIPDIEGNISIAVLKKDVIDMYLKKK